MKGKVILKYLHRYFKKVPFIFPLFIQISYGETINDKFTHQDGASAFFININNLYTCFIKYLKMTII